MELQDITQDYKSADVVICVSEEREDPFLIKNRFGGSAPIGFSTMQQLARMFKEQGLHPKTGIMRVVVMGSNGMQHTAGIEQVVNDDHEVEQDFVARMLDAADGMSAFLTVEEVEGYFSGFQVVLVKRAQYRETRFIMRSFIGPAGDDPNTLYEERANEYVIAASEIFGLEIRA